jgi:glycosyltransferase involved in cell wall biosynthesis
MKIIWIVNIPLPQASKLLKEQETALGSWLVNTSLLLSNRDDIQLVIAFPRCNSYKLKCLDTDNIIFFTFPCVKDKSKSLMYNTYIEELIIDQKPDLVNIYGTEMPHSLSVINTCNLLSIKTVITMQGLVSIIDRHLYSNLPLRVIHGRTIRNILLKDSIVDLRNLYKIRGKYEKEALKKTKHVIGRTTWDKVCSTQINSSINYHYCNEILREEFYNHHWIMENCQKHSIVLSQGHYPIKGLHYVLEALPLILSRFPNTILYVSGKNPLSSKTYRSRLSKTYYQKHIEKLIKKLSIRKSIVFTGILNEKEMCSLLLKANVFVSSSTIENESNSISEAKILGVPVVASYVGGVIDRINHSVDGFYYHHDAPYMLANYVNMIFDNERLAISLSMNARKSAMKLHDRSHNIDTLVSIYKEIIDNNE